MRHDRPSAGAPGQGRGSANRAVYGEEWEARLAQARAERARIQALKRAAMLQTEPAEEPAFSFLPDAMPDLIDENDLPGAEKTAPERSEAPKPAPVVTLHPGLRVAPEPAGEPEPRPAFDLDPDFARGSVADEMPDLAFVPPAAGLAAPEPLATAPVVTAPVATAPVETAAAEEAPMEAPQAPMPHPVLDPALDAPRRAAPAGPEALDVPVYMPARLHLSEVRRRRRGLWAARGVAGLAVLLIVAAYAAPSDAPGRLASFVSSVTNRVLAPEPAAPAAPPVAAAAVVVPEPLALAAPAAPRTAPPAALAAPAGFAPLALPGPERGDTLLVTAAPVAPEALRAELAFAPPAALPPEPAPQAQPVPVAARAPAPPAPAEAAAILRGIATSVAAERLTVFLQVPFGAPEAAATSLFLQLNGAGLAVERPFRMEFALDQHQVRYYHAEDATLATGLAQAIGGTARAFTDVRLAPPVGTVEVWMAGGPQG